MGRVEKIIVLSVLFLVTLILVVSLNTSEEPGGFSSDPRIDQLLGTEAAETVAAAPATADRGEPAAPLAAAPGGPAPEAWADPDLGDLPERPDREGRGATPRRPEDPGERLLSSTVERPGRGAADAPEAGAVPATPAGSIPAGSILVTLHGLEESYLDEYRFYTLRPGDDFGVLAERFYGDRRRVGLLRGANEGPQGFVTGDTILVPVYAPDLPAERAGAQDATGATAADAVYHVVREGDSLWKIAQEHYGRGTRWREIYEANRDRMPSEDALSVGMRLRIP